MVPPHAASLALEQDSLTVTLGIVRDIVTEVNLLHFPGPHVTYLMFSSIQIRKHLCVCQVAQRGACVSICFLIVI